MNLEYFLEIHMHDKSKANSLIRLDNREHKDIHTPKMFFPHVKLRHGMKLILFAH